MSAATAASALITIDGQATSSRTIALPTVTTNIRVVVSDGSQSRSYSVTVMRPPLLAGDAWIKASNTGARDEFGSAVALSADGSTLVIGAPHESSSATTINGNQADDSASEAGAAYVFLRGANGWTQQAYLKASNAEAGDSFGNSVALSQDGNTLAVGAHYERSAATTVNGNQTDNSGFFNGAVYVFTRSSGVWSQQAYLKASNGEASDYFGGAVAISGDGNTIAVGAVGEDSSGAGPTDNTAPYAGATYLFIRAGGLWTQQAYLKASNAETADRFGSTAALSFTGDTLAVGAIGEDSNARGINGDQSNNASAFSGATYVFNRVGSLWAQQAYVKASDTHESDEFGTSVALSTSGDTLAVGAPRENSGVAFIETGAVFVFTRAAGAWSQQALVRASVTDGGDLFGTSVALSGDGNTLAVGANGEDSNATGVNGDATNNSLAVAGAAYAFIRTGGAWSQRAYLKASNPDPADNFGYRVAISGDATTIASAAYAEDSAATGINNPNLTDNSAESAGAVYTFFNR